MWSVLESSAASKALDQAPTEVTDRYDRWLSIAQTGGPMGLAGVRGFRDEALAGEWKGSRSCRLGDQWRVIYRVDSKTRTFYVERVSAHNYRR